MYSTIQLYIQTLLQAAGNPAKFGVKIILKLIHQILTWVR